MKPAFSVFITLAFTLSAHAQCSKPEVVSGPMLGYAEHREALVWVQTRCAKSVSIVYYPESNSSRSKTMTCTLAAKPGGEAVISKFVLPGLEMGTRYTYKILLNGKTDPFSYPLQFSTKNLWEYRTDPPRFSFLAGSCNYINDSLYDRPGRSYGAGTGIFSNMAESGADFMIWLGDNTYLREADYSSMSGIRYRYEHTRKTPDMQKLLRVMNHYATWDDHDYGPNDANSSYELRDSTLHMFREYWGNKTYGLSDDPGVYSRFSYGDCDFFLLDNRYHRDANDEKDTSRPGRTQLGEKQLQWLKNGLASSRATFKFVCIGGQVLNESNRFEAYTKYAAERMAILDFIADNKIRGVVFISGDRHMTEVEKKVHKGVNLYEITSSPLTSGEAHVSGAEVNNPLRVDGTLVEDQNYCMFSLTGKLRDRTLLVQCFDESGKKRWELKLHESEVK